MKGGDLIEAGFLWIFIVLEFALGCGAAAGP